MKTLYLPLVLSSSILLFFGCGSDESKVSSNLTTASKTQISTKKEAIDAANTITIVSGFAKTNESVSETRASKQRIAIDETKPCATSGNVHMSGDISLFSTTLTSNYTSCNENNSLMNGSTKASGSLTDLDIEMIDLSVETDTLYSLSNLKLNIATSLLTTSTTLDGIVEYEDKENSDVGSVAYTDFVVKTNSVSGKNEYDGNTTLKSSLYSCIDGMYTYKTISSLKSEEDGSISSGELEINGALFSFNAGTISVTLENGETYTISQNSEIICE